MNSTELIELVESFAARGVTLTVSGGGLALDAPKGALMPADLDLLRARKAELIEYLAQAPRRVAREPGSVPAVPAVPATPAAPEILRSPGPPSRVRPRRDPRLASWPEEWRRRWSDRANALEDEGMDWDEASARAFAELLPDWQASGEPLDLLAGRSPGPSDFPEDVSAAIPLASVYRAYDAAGLRRDPDGGWSRPEKRDT
jgi:TubC N-terminal docking domain